MTRHPGTVHAIPLDARGGHRPSIYCACGPAQATDLVAPGAVIVVHRDTPPEPADCCAALEAAIDAHAGTGHRLTIAAERCDAAHRKDVTP